MANWLCNCSLAGWLLASLSAARASQQARKQGSQRASKQASQALAARNNEKFGQLCAAPERPASGAANGRPRAPIEIRKSNLPSACSAGVWPSGAQAAPKRSPLAPLIQLDRSAIANNDNPFQVNDTNHHHLASGARPSKCERKRAGGGALFWSARRPPACPCSLLRAPAPTTRAAFVVVIKTNLQPLRRRVGAHKEGAAAAARVFAALASCRAGG